MAPKLLSRLKIALLLIGLNSIQSTIGQENGSSGEEVSLIWPAFQSLKLDEFESPTNLKFTGSTRAGNYTVHGFDSVKGSKHADSRIETSWFRTPPLIKDLYALYTHDNHLDNMLKWHIRLTKEKMVDLTGPELFWFRHDGVALFYHNDSTNGKDSLTFSAVVKDLRLQICRQKYNKTEDSCADSRLLATSFKDLSPLVRASGIMVKYIQAENKLHTWIADHLGRIGHSEWSFTYNEAEKRISVFEHKSNNFVDISAIQASRSTQRWQVPESINQSLSNYFTSRFDEKFRGAYVEAMVPQYANYSAPGNMTGICLVNGFKLSSFVCSGKEAPTLETSNTKETHIYAMTFGAIAGTYYYHIAYGMLKGNNYEYGYYFNNFTGSPREHRLKLDDPTKHPFKATMTPNAFVTYQDGKCNKLITFLDTQYYMNDLNEPMPSSFMTNSSAIVTPLLNSAMFYGGDLFVFTHTNTLLRIKLSMSDDCKELVSFEERDFTEMYSEDFILPFFGLTKSESRQPLMLDYRQYSIKNRTVQPDSDIHWDKVNSSSGGSAMIVIIGLILGGLILASLLYVFCLRNADQDQLTMQAQPGIYGVKSKKGIKSTPDELHAVTVRSAVEKPASKIDGGPAAKPKSPLQALSSKKSILSKKSRSPGLPVRSPSKKSLKSSSSPAKSPSSAGKSKSKSSKSPKKSPNSKLSSPSSKSKSPASPVSKTTIVDAKRKP